MRALVTWLVVLAAAAGCAGCGNASELEPRVAAPRGDAGPGPEEGEVVGDPGFRLALSQAVLEVPQGGGDAIRVQVLRDGYDGAVEVIAQEVPEGMISLSQIAPPGFDEVSLPFSAAFELALPTPVTVRVTGRNDRGSVTLPLAVLVRGPPGTLDGSFGEAGERFVLEDARAGAAAATADGGLVLAASPGNGLPGGLRVARVDAAGATVVEVPIDFDEGPAVARDVLAGAGDEAFVLATVVGAGDSDSDLGIARVAGREVTTEVLDLGGEDAAGAIAQAHGRIVVAASRRIGGGAREIVLAGLTKEGTLDSSFGIVPTGIAGHPRDLLVMPDGGLVVVGGEPWLLARFRPDGSPAGRRAALSLGAGAAVAAVVDDAGRIVLAGEREGDIAITAVLPGGKVDPTFGEGGWVRLAGVPHDLALLAAGELLLAGESEDEAAFVARLRKNGELGAFGEDGIAQIGRGRARALILHEEARVTVAGDVEEKPGRAVFLRRVWTD